MTAAAPWTARAADADLVDFERGFLKPRAAIDLIASHGPLR
jgi:hypothetical protein